MAETNKSDETGIKAEDKKPAKPKKKPPYEYPQIEVRGPALKGGKKIEGSTEIEGGAACGIFMHEVRRKLREDALQVVAMVEAGEIDVSNTEKTLIDLTPEVLTRFCVYITAHFEDGVSREAIFESLLRTLRDQDHIDFPRHLRPALHTKAFESCRESLDSFFDPKPRRAFTSPEKGQVSRAFNAAGADEQIIPEVWDWIKSIYKGLTNKLDNTWRNQLDKSKNFPDIVKPENVLGLETDPRFKRNTP